MFKENLPKKGSLFSFEPKNPPIWAAHTRTLNMLFYPLPGFYYKNQNTTVEGFLIQWK